MYSVLSLAPDFEVTAPLLLVEVLKPLLRDMPTDSHWVWKNGGVASIASKSQKMSENLHYNIL